MIRRGGFTLGFTLFGLAAMMTGCATDQAEPPATRPDIAARTARSSETLPLDNGQIKPMYHELLAIDLANVVQVAKAQNIDIKQARERVVAARGRYESTIESIVPALSPGLAFGHVEGVNTAVTGQLVPADFTTVSPFALVQLLLNPGQVYYDAIAAKKRLLGTEQQERQIVMETLRQSLAQYYDLTFAQVRVSVARQAVTEADELLRLTRLKLQAGTGLPADEARSVASLAARQQDLTLALNTFYQASVALAVTLHLDPTVTLAPKPEQIVQTTLVRDDLGVEDMLAVAVAERPDLQSVRSFAVASGADASAVLWNGVGPQLQGRYQVAGIQSRASGQNFDMQEQQQAAASVGWTLSLASLGKTKTADATERQALLEAERTLDIVRADVVRSMQESAAQSKLIPTAKQQVDAAAEALRLAQASLRTGNALTLDVLQAEDALSDARQRYANAILNYNKSQVALLAALGLLDEASLSLAAIDD